MLKVNELKAAIKKCGYTQEKTAELIDMNPRTFYNRLKRKKFGSDEIDKLIDVLNLDKLDAVHIFLIKR